MQAGWQKPRLCAKYLPGLQNARQHENTISDGEMEEEPAGMSEMCVFGVGCGGGCLTVLKDALVCKKKNGCGGQQGGDILMQRQS